MTTRTWGRPRPRGERAAPPVEEGGRPWRPYAFSGLRAFSGTLLAAGVLAATGFCPALAEAREFFAAPSDGSARLSAAAGSRKAPFRSLQEATSALRPGDVLTLLPGRYLEPLEIRASGTADAPVRVRGVGRPEIEAGYDAVSISGSYVVVEGLSARAPGLGSAFAVGKHNHHVTLVDDVARDSGCGGVSAQYTDYLTVRRVTAYGNGRRSPWQCSGISLYHPEASDTRPGVHNLIEDNLAYDNANAFVDEAISHSHGRTTDGNGVIVDDADHTEADTQSPPYRGLTVIANNVVCDNGGRGIHVFHSSNVLITHNIAYRDVKDPNLEGPAGEISALFSRGVAAVANIIVARPGAPPEMDGYDAGGNRFDFNLLVSDRGPLAVATTTAPGSHDRRAADPGLTRPVPGPGGDWALRAGSPAAGLARGAAIGLPSPLATFVSASPDAGLLAPGAVGAPGVLETRRSAR